MIQKFVLPLSLALISLVSACARTTVVPTPTPVVTPTLALTATAEPTATPAVLTVTDGLNRTVTVPALPKRIVSLAASTTEMLFAVGAGAQVVGRDQNSDYPPDVKNVTDIGSTYQTLNSEAIVALKPDLVLAAGFNSPEEVKTLQDLGLTVYLFTNPADFDGVYQDLTVTGQLTGHNPEAASLVNSLHARVVAVTTKVKNAADKPLVYYEIDGSDATKPWTSGPGTFMDAMLTLAGGRNIGANLKDSFAQISLEEIVKQDPDFIVLGDSLTGIMVESVGQRAGWAQLTAVKKGNVYAFDDSLASRPGPRLVDGLEILAKLLHPDLFK